MSGCELCEAHPWAPWHHEDEICWVADCESCDLPMVVWKSHGTEPAPDVEAHMLAALGRAADSVLGEGAWRLDAVRRQIPDHWHAHARRNVRW